jgi:hypothetical protein
MATKNLARTAIEGGRTGRNKWERRNSHNTERTSAREYCTKVKYDLDAADELFIQEKDPVWKDFADKLGPMYRWLERQVGKPWDEVRSEVTKAFDTRTTAGRHIVYDHLLRSVEITPDVYRYRYYRNTGDDTTSYSKHDFYVNDDGILCVRKYIPRRQKLPTFDTRQIANWLSGRIVGKVGDKLFWFVPADKGKKRGGYNHQWKCDWSYRSYYSNGLRFLYLTYKPIYKTDSLGYILLDDAGNKIVKDYEESWVAANPYAFRQDRKLNEKEAAFWKTIPEYYQNKVLELSPTYNGPKPDPYRSYYYY